MVEFLVSVSLGRATGGTPHTLSNSRTDWHLKNISHLQSCMFLSDLCQCAIFFLGKQCSVLDLQQFFRVHNIIIGAAGDGDCFQETGEEVVTVSGSGYTYDSKCFDLLTTPLLPWFNPSQTFGPLFCSGAIDFEIGS